MAVIAPGTGLGEAFLTWNGHRYQAYASEGGHADFAPNGLLEIELLEYLHRRLGHVSSERVCSGKGLPNIYAFLRDSGYAKEPEWLRSRLALTQDPTPIIIDAALDENTPCEICAQTLHVFTSILAAEAGNLALKVLATGGVYFGGGIPRRIIRLLKEDRFLQAFRQKGRMSDLLAKLPVHVITNPRAALIGAASYAFHN